MTSAARPLVSVVTRVYNGELHLREGFESVLAQTYTSWTYMIVNNCSTDRTLDIAQEYAARDSRRAPITVSRAQRERMIRSGLAKGQGRGGVLTPASHYFARRHGPACSGTALFFPDLPRVCAPLVVADQKHAGASDG